MQRDPELDKKVMDNYQKGQGTIQQIAIFYNISVEEVLKIIGMDDMNEVTMVGDMVDSAEVGADVELSPGKKVKVPYHVERV